MTGAMLDDDDDVVCEATANINYSKTSDVLGCCDSTVGSYAIMAHSVLVMLVFNACNGPCE